MHPALLDAALHMLDVGRGERDGEVEVPFAWADVVLHAAGASAAAGADRPVRRREGRVPDPGRCRRAGWWPRSVRWCCGRCPAGPGAAGTRAAREALFRLEWVPARPQEPAADAGRWAVLGSDAGLNVPGAVRYADLAGLAAAVAAGQGVPDTVVACCVPGGVAYPRTVPGLARPGWRGAWRQRC